MALNSEFAARCNSLRASARQLLKERAAWPEDCRVSDGLTVTASPASLRMSMGELRKRKPVTLCTFSRSELMSVLYMRHHAHFECHRNCSSSDCAYKPGNRVKLDLSRLRAGENEWSVEALKVALQQTEVGIMNGEVSIRSVRLGLAPLYITDLNLRQNKIRCNGMVEISKALSGMKHLQVLDVSGNHLGYAGWNALARIVLASRHLNELDVSGNCIQTPTSKAGVFMSPKSPGRDFPAHINSLGDSVEDSKPADIDLFASSIAASPSLVRFACSSCSLNARQITLICTAACISANLCILDVSGNQVLESTNTDQEHDATSEYARMSKSDVAQEARALIVRMREAAVCAQFEQLGIALGVFVTLKRQSPDRLSCLIMQSILQSRSVNMSWIQEARAAFWNGMLHSVSSRMCSLDEFDITANSLDLADERVVLAILNKLTADGVSKISVGHAFVKYPSISVKVVESLTASCSAKYLHSLNLTGTLIGNDGAVMLARALGYRAYGWPKELHLSKCNISDAGCIALIDALARSASKNATPIGTVNLSQNTITDDALVAISPLMFQLIDLHVSSWVDFIRDIWKDVKNRSHGLKYEFCADYLQQSYFTIQKLDLESNIISEIGLKLLTTPLMCKTVHKQRAAALAALVREQEFPIADLVNCLELGRFKPMIQNLRIGGNLCHAPAEGKVVHICGAISASPQECSPVLDESHQSVQAIMLSALLRIHTEDITSHGQKTTHIMF